MPDGPSPAFPCLVWNTATLHCPAHQRQFALLRVVPGTAHRPVPRVTPCACSKPFQRLCVVCVLLLLTCTVTRNSVKLTRPLCAVPQFSPLPAKCTIVRPSSDEYDVIIVGAGTCGAALAVSLGRQGRRVLLIERSMIVPVSAWCGNQLARKRMLTGNAFGDSLDSCCLSHVVVPTVFKVLMLLRAYSCAGSHRG